MNDWLAFMKKYNPEGDLTDLTNAYGYSAAATMVQVLKQCVDDLTRENVMKQATNLKNFELPLLLPGIKINTSPTNFFPINQESLIKCDGKIWVPFGGVVSG